MTPSQARDLALDYGHKRLLHLAADDYAAARKAEALSVHYADLAESISKQSPSSSPNPSKAETKQAGANSSRLRPAPIPAEPDTSVAAGITIDREGNIIDLATGEIEDCLMAQLGLGIVSAREFLRATRETQGEPVDAIGKACAGVIHPNTERAA